MSFQGNAREFVQRGNCTGIQLPGGKNGIQPTSGSLPCFQILDLPRIDGGVVDLRRVKHALIKRFSGWVDREMTAMSRLAVLIATALLWVIAIQEYNAFPELLANFEIRDQALNGAKIAAAEQLQVVERIRAMMATLSMLPAVKTRDRLACNAYLTTMQSQFPALIMFLVTDPGGVSFCDTNSDHRPITIADRPYFKTALQTGEFTVGEFTTGLSTGQNVVQFALPFRDDGGHLAGVIVTALSLDWLGDYVARMDIPKGTVLAVMDESGTYLARSSEKDRFVGTKKPGWKSVKLDERGAVDVLDVDAVKRVEGYSAVPVGSGRLVVSFGIDKNARARTSLAKPGSVPNARLVAHPVDGSSWKTYGHKRGADGWRLRVTQPRRCLAAEAGRRYAPADHRAQEGPLSMGVDGTLEAPFNPLNALHHVSLTQTLSSSRHYDLVFESSVDLAAWGAHVSSIPDVARSLGMMTII